MRLKALLPAALFIAASLTAPAKTPAGQELPVALYALYGGKYYPVTNVDDRTPIVDTGGTYLQSDAAPETRLIPADEGSDADVVANEGQGALLLPKADFERLSKEQSTPKEFRIDTTLTARSAIKASYLAFVIYDPATLDPHAKEPPFFVIYTYETGTLQAGKARDLVFTAVTSPLSGRDFFKLRWFMLLFSGRKQVSLTGCDNRVNELLLAQLAWAKAHPPTRQE